MLDAVTASGTSLADTRQAQAPAPDVVFLGKGALPEDGLERKLAILTEHFRLTMIGVTRARPPRIHGVRIIALPALRPPLLGGLLFYAAGPVLALRRGVKRTPSAIVCQSPLEGLGTVALSRLVPRDVRPRIVIEAHGDWRIATRLYGSTARRSLSPLIETLARWTLRRADLVRVVSHDLERLVRATGYGGPILRFATYSEYGEFTDSPAVPMPGTPQVAFVGGLEPTKGIDVLVEAWPEVLREVPTARLVLVGEGSLGARLRARVTELGCETTVTFLGSRSRAGVREVLDRSSLLVLPSRSEGLPRVVFEALARARPVVATAVGGIAEVVDDGRNGFLVQPDDRPALAGALSYALRDPDRLRRMGEAGRRDVTERDPMGEYEEGMRRIAEWIRTSKLPGGDPA